MSSGEKAGSATQQHRGGSETLYPRKRYSHAVQWKIEEASLESTERERKHAVAISEGGGGPEESRQVLRTRRVWNHMCATVCVSVVIFS